jgi:chromosome segregation ATPase
MKIRNLTLLLLIMLSVVGCEDKKKEAQNNAQIENLRDSMNQVISQKEAEINDIMGTFNDIQEGFDEINQAEGRVNLEKSNPEKSSRQSIMENIEFIRRTMQLNKERIARLQEQLKTSSFNTSKLKATIESLNKQMEEKAQQITKLQEELKAKDLKIAEQGQQINSLTGDVADLTQQNEQKAQTVARQDAEINTAWYVFGTKRELKAQRILQNGNVLKTSTFNKDYFTKVDIRVVKSIKLYSKSARLLTSHPAGSYTLDRDAQKQYTLHITNPQQFWSVSKYLVILVR